MLIAIKKCRISMDEIEKQFFAILWSVVIKWGLTVAYI